VKECSAGFQPAESLLQTKSLPSSTCRQDAGATISSRLLSPAGLVSRQKLAKRKRIRVIRGKLFRRILPRGCREGLLPFAFGTPYLIRPLGPATESRRHRDAAVAGRRVCCDTADQGRTCSPARTATSRSRLSVATRSLALLERAVETWIISRLRIRIGRGRLKTSLASFSAWASTSRP